MNNLNEEERRALQELARHQMIRRLLSDIATDMNVCKLEHWDIYEFPRMLKKEIDRYVRKENNEQN